MFMSASAAIATVQVRGEGQEASIVADRGATRKIPGLVFLLSVIVLCTQALLLWSVDSRRVTTVPALGVFVGGQTGIVHYIVLQIDKDPRQEGPIVQFNEINLGGGSVVSDDWKEGVKHAVAVGIVAA